ncbi:hypothetical protein SAMN04487968_105115 [Nocardioides terrae]|uniref:Uncharacterized protein n=1 Tax=Nocardioides terrae TaxID=574651 RepID=A0A1I1I4Q6_9ACTN|nr:hypothetical protein [Nocardioides terrae]SFC30792.1 hypothetical protein SAMN04487968_105115 [Nocardioides terrae]
MELGPQPPAKTEPPEIVPGGPDALDHEGGGVVRDIRASNPPTPGDEEVGMGVSSERVGHTGPGQTGTDGVKDTSVTEDGDTDVPPEQRPGNVETNPEGLEPKAGYPSLDPRSKDE